MPYELPQILVVELQGGALDSPFRLLQSRYRVVTCPVESVALEYVTESRPSAVLMDATALYLEGPGLLDRWKAASPGTRVLFLDTEGPWALLMEPSDTDSGMVTINPCGVEEIAPALGEMLDGSGRKEVPDDRLAILAV